MDKTAITESFAVMRAAWPSAELFRQDKHGQAQSITLWARMAADIPNEIGKATVLELIGSRKFPPSIAEFIEAAKVKMPKMALKANEAPTLAEGMKVIRLIDKMGGLDEWLASTDPDDPYRIEYERTKQ